MKTSPQNQPEKLTDKQKKEILKRDKVFVSDERINVNEHYSMRFL